MSSKSTRGQAALAPRASQEPAEVHDIIPNLQPDSPNSLRLIKAPLGVLNDEQMVKVLVNMPFTNVGNAECFVHLFKDQLRYCRTRGTWLAWDGVKWAKESDSVALRAAIETLRARQAAALRLQDDNTRSRLLKFAISSEEKGAERILKLARHLKEVEVTVDQFDKDPFKIGVRNGVIDLRAPEGKEFRPGRRDDYISMQLGCDYDPSAVCDLWERSLNQYFESIEETVEYIRRTIGYTITGDVSEQVLFLCYGGGANGKSVFLETLTKLLGDYAGTANFSTFDAERKGENTNDIADLKGTRFVSVIETDEDKRLAEAKVKLLTGKDPVKCRHLFKENFTYYPTYKIFMAMNHLPRINNTDRGIWRRIRLVPFTQSFEGREDHYLGEKLEKELSGILNWALKGARQWMKTRLGSAPIIQDATESYKKDSDLIGQWLDEWCKVDLIEGSGKPNQASLVSCQSSEGFQSYRAWCKERGYPLVSNRSFSLGMLERGFKRKKTTNSNIFLGIEIMEHGT